MRLAVDLRDEMLAAALALVHQRGVDLGLNTVSFDDALRAADVPRASAYRAWSDDSDSGPQKRFHDELAERVLLAQAGSPGVVASIPDALATVAATVNKFHASAHVGADPLRRGRAMREMIRSAGRALEGDGEPGRIAICRLAVVAALISRREAGPEFHALMAVSHQRMAEQLRESYAETLVTFGLRLRPCYLWEHFDTVSGALAEGMLLRHGARGTSFIVTRATGGRRELQEWTLFAVGMEALVNHFFEPLPGGAMLVHEGYGDDAINN